jgi:hypothetical protein
MSKKTLKSTLEDLEIKEIKKSLVKFQNNHSEMAKYLGLKRTTLLMKMKKYKIFDQFVEKKIIKLLFIFLFFFGCSTQKDLVKDAFINNAPIVEPIILPASGYIKVTCSGCASYYKNKLPIIELKLNSIVQGDCFKKSMQPKIDMTNGLTSDQVTTKIVSAKETANIIFYYKRFSKAVGYENGDGNIYANTKFWSGYGICNMVSNVTHEVTHKLGFSHNGNSPAGNENTVPYRANAAIESCCKD